MFDPGDELTLASSGIPWLIWIQLIVLFLLIALLYCFTLFAWDSADDTSTATAATANVGPTATESPSSSRLPFDDIQQLEKPSAKHDSAASTFVINRRQNTQNLEWHVDNHYPLANPEELRQQKKEEGVKWYETMEPERERAFNLYKPCYFIEQFVKAISKCLGLDSATERTEGGPSGGKNGAGTSTTSRGLRKPSRPPLTAGQGGQVNVSSS